jgi:transcriptional regulator with XRE-family HTH domain
MRTEQFWETVKREVDRQNTSFEWLYRKTGIPKGTFASWKHRQRIPRADEACRIARALDVSVEYLLTGLDAHPPASNPVLEAIAMQLTRLETGDLQAVKALVDALAAKPARKN